MELVQQLGNCRIFCHLFNHTHWVVYLINKLSLTEDELTHLVTFDLEFLELRLELLIRSNREKRATWVELIGSSGSLLISLEKASEIVAFPKVQTQVRRLFDFAPIKQLVAMALVVDNVLII